MDFFSYLFCILYVYLIWIHYNIFSCIFFHFWFFHGYLKIVSRKPSGPYCTICSDKNLYGHALLLYHWNHFGFQFVMVILIWVIIVISFSCSISCVVIAFQVLLRSFFLQLAHHHLARGPDCDHFLKCLIRSHWECVMINHIETSIGMAGHLTF